MKDGNIEQSSLEADDQSARKGIVEDFVNLLKETVPVLDKIKSSIEESTDKIPTASEHLTAVNKVTESATLHILKDVELMSASIDSMIIVLTNFKNIINSSTDLMKNIIEKIRVCVDTMQGAGMYHEVSMMNDFIDQLENGDSILKIENQLNEIKKRTLNIAITLQMQDIAAQQITAVSSLIESVRIQLLRVLNQFDSTPGLKNKMGLEFHNDTIYEEDKHLIDAAFHFTLGIDRQSSTDEIVKEWSNMNKIL
jgi:chemotaxis regulatin CheY-phosphate phosphatase CheZ